MANNFCTHSLGHPISSRYQTQPISEYRDPTLNVPTQKVDAVLNSFLSKQREDSSSSRSSSLPKTNFTANAHCRDNPSLFSSASFNNLLDSSVSPPPPLGFNFLRSFSKSRHLSSLIGMEMPVLVSKNRIALICIITGLALTALGIALAKPVIIAIGVVITAIGIAVLAKQTKESWISCLIR